MTVLKTKPTSQSVIRYIKSIEDYKQRKDCMTLMSMMKQITNKRPTMWGDSIIGYGRYHYKYKSGREGEWFVTGFAPRKNNLSVYIMPGFSKYDGIMARLGKHKVGVSCLYVKRLEDIDLEQLQALIEHSVNDMAKLYNCR